MTDERKSDLPMPMHREKGQSAQADQQPHPHRGRIGYIVPVVVALGLIFTGGVLGLYFQPPGLQRFFEATGLQPGGGTDTPIAIPRDVAMTEEMAAAIRPTDVVGLARLLPRGDISVVAPPFGSGDARIAEVLVAIGDSVAKGEIVARLDNAADLESGILSAQADVAIREASLLQTRQSVATSLLEAQANLAQAEAAAEQARTELARVRTLQQRGVATQANLEQAVSAEAQAQTAVAAAQAALSRYQYEDLDAQPEVRVAERNLQAARIELERARLELAKSDVTAPIAGTVLDIHVTPGERIADLGVMDIGDIDRMMAEVEVYQTQIGAVEPDQSVELAAEALSQTLKGKVERIGLTVGRQGMIADDVAANTDARVITVLVRLDEESSRIARGFTDLEVIARIETEPQG